MKRFLFALASIVALARAESLKTPRDLLDGRSLAAWELVVASAALPAKAPATEDDLASICKFAADGALAVTGKPMSFLATKAAYENYRLHAEWRWPAGAAKNSNSGILLHIASGPTGGTAWPLCFQLQLKPIRAGDLLPMHGAKFAEKLSTPPDAKTPQLDRVAAPGEKPLGEWNACDIVCRGDTIEIAVNGVHQNKITRCTPAAGRIGFQLEGTPFELRHVRLAPLK